MRFQVEKQGRSAVICHLMADTRADDERLTLDDTTVFQHNADRTRSRDSQLDRDMCVAAVICVGTRIGRPAITQGEIHAR